MNWTVNLTVSFIPCPAEHIPAWRAAMQALRELAMRGDNYPPESEYWHTRAMQAASKLCGQMGYQEYAAWLDGQGEPAHWRALYDLLREKEIALVILPTG